MLDRLAIRNGFVTRDFGIRAASRLYVALPDTRRIDAEHRDLLLQLLALAGWTQGLRLENQCFELLAAI
jgi:hypothetical protein